MSQPDHAHPTGNNSSSDKDDAATRPEYAIITKKDTKADAFLPQSSANEGWDKDVENPRNWSNVRKWRNTAIVTFYAMITPLGSSMMASALPQIAEHFHTTSLTLAAVTLGIYVIAWAIGRVYIAPLSETYGRLWILHFSNLLFGIFCLAQIYAPNTIVLTVFRFFAGIGGCAPLSIGGSCIIDMFKDKERGTALSIYHMGPLLGPVIGPIIGGFMAQKIGFRYIFMFLAALSGVTTLIGVPVLEETYGPAIQDRLVKRLLRDVEKHEKTQHASPVPSPPLTPGTSTCQGHSYHSRNASLGSRTRPSRHCERLVGHDYVDL